MGLATPTLIVWGEEDRVLDPSGAEILHRSLPNSQIVMMPGIGHMPMLEAPRQAGSDYKKFRAGLPSAGTPCAPQSKPSRPGSSKPKDCASMSRETVQVRGSSRRRAVPTLCGAKRSEG